MPNALTAAPGRPDRGIRGMAGRLFDAMGGLFAFAGPTRGYHPATAAEIEAAAWAQTGAALRGAMQQAQRGIATTR
ncbi:hypothetical protein HUK83_07795 [Endobacter medicaginis]|uniref:Uncharacterized protein n=2 Tax=Endobacter medicaginis TaxID=1181271 RepID=A0A850NMT1_9PROT|nr:hypothetical protein [Endobacter medicaginis]NVN30234.1 hypothetical protein [Endobacter medicaginis]